MTNRIINIKMLMCRPERKHSDKGNKGKNKESSKI